MTTLFLEEWPDTSFSQWDDEGSLSPPAYAATGGILTATIPASTHSYSFYSPTATLPSLADGASFAWKADINNVGNSYSAVDFDFNGIARQGIFDLSRDWDVSIYSDGSLFVTTLVSGTNSFTADPASPFYRLRRGGATVYFESSADGETGWTTIFSEGDYTDTPASLTLTLSIYATALGTGADARLGRILYGATDASPTLTATYDDTNARVVLTVADVPADATATITRHDAGSSHGTVVRGSQRAETAFVVHDYEFTAGAAETYVLDWS